MATTQLNPSEISELIKTRIEKVKLTAEARNEGTVTSVSDGIVRIYGLADVMQGEMIELPNSTYALALNLERDSVGAVVLGDYEHLREGDVAKTTGRILEVPIGPELLGRVVKAKVTAASELPSAELDAIKAALRKRFGREVEIETAVDASLIGGAVIDAGDVVIDGSLKGKLERLQSTLSQ